MTLRGTSLFQRDDTTTVGGACSFGSISCFILFNIVYAIYLLERKKSLISLLLFLSQLIYIRNIF